MTFEAWALFCLTEFTLCLNPGPSTLLVISLAMTRGQLPRSRTARVGAPLSASSADCRASAARS
jgi:threonine/homoserine/homoserine lactone efflux protein